MALDTFSLLLLNLLVTAALALSLFVVAERGRPDGLFFWALALTCFTGVPLLFALQELIPGWPTTVLPNVLMGCAFALNIQGLYQFQQRPLPWLWAWLPVPLLLLASALLDAHPAPRALAVALLLLLQLAHFSRCFHQHWEQTPGRGKHLFAGGITLMLVALCIRAANILSAGPALQPLTAAGDTQALVMCLLTVAMVVSSLGATLMTKERADARNHELAFVDELTALPNRRAIERQLRQQLAQAQRQQLPLSLLVLDIDHFKRINDQYGHLGGDRVLRTFARCLERHLRTQDIAGRWGGEEFIVLLPHTDNAGALVVAERLRCAVQAQAFEGLQQQAIAVTTSIGLHTTTPDMLQEPAALLDAADRALYQAKQGGRNQVAHNPARPLDRAATQDNRSA